MTTDDLLKAICGRDSREICQNPWTVVLDGITYSAATDGMRALFIADASSPYPAEPYPLTIAKLLRAALDAPEERAELSRTELLAEVGEGAPVDWGAACHDCGGEGSQECDLGHTHDCDACGGNGSIKGANGYSFLRAAPLSITINDRRATIDTQMLRGVIANLPGDPIRVGFVKGCVFFSGDGWDLLVAEMHRTEHGPDIRSIEARPSALGGAHGEH